jgi:hypothetical protein
MRTKLENWKRRHGVARGFALAALSTLSHCAEGAFAAPYPQEPQGEIIGTIEGQAISVKGPMSVQVVGNEVKTVLRSAYGKRPAGHASSGEAETIAVWSRAYFASEDGSA